MIFKKPVSADDCLYSFIKTDITSFGKSPSFRGNPGLEGKSAFGGSPDFEGYPRL